MFDTRVSYISDAEEIAGIIVVDSSLHIYLHCKQLVKIFEKFDFNVLASPRNSFH